MILKKFAFGANCLFAGLLLFGATSCVYINEELGSDFIQSNQKYKVSIMELPLTDIRIEMSDSLSGYSSSRITVGAVREAPFGLTSRSSAFTLVPALDTMDFGTNTRFRQFHFTACKDTLSYPNENQKNIIQNINVYALKQELDSTFLYTNSLSNADFAGEARITNGVPLYSGGDSLAFDFSEEFAKHYMTVTQEELDSISKYVKRFPGIYISVDSPIGDGGRINMFDLAIEVNESYYVSGNYAELKFTADYGDRKDVDTSFLYYFGVMGEAQSSSLSTQYSFNVSEHETAEKSSGFIGKATDKIYVEGGGGLKPVISAKEIKSKIEQLLLENGIEDPSKVIINKATVVLPFEFPSDYGDLDLFPAILSPTCRIRSETNKNYISYAGLTDSSVSTENQGDINRSTGCYSPDISHHVQEILRLDEDSDFEKYDIWFLIMAEEVEESSSSSSSSYYDDLAYANYYNMLYDPYYGYGSYGYGSYGYGYGYYDNYYNYNYYLSMLYSSSSSSSSSETSTQLDKDRYYAAILNGPEAADPQSRPKLKIFYSVIDIK